MKKKAIIIGAGPAGLTAAYELIKRTDIVPVIVEASNDIGGISKTIAHNNNRMDMGGHRFFSKSRKIMDWWLNILPLQGKPAKDDIILNRDIELSAFENAIACIEGDSLICAYQYGVSEPFQIYYGAAVAAIYLDDKPKAKVYYRNFSELANRSKDKERCREQLDWLDRQINSSESQKNIIN